MNLLQDTKFLLEKLEQVKEARKQVTTSREAQQSKAHKFKKTFRVTYLKGAIEFLDLKSILTLSLIDKEFNYFIKSIYFYKFVSQVRESHQRINKKVLDYIKKQPVEVKKDSDYLSNFMGAFTNAFGFGGKKPNLKKEEKEIDPKLLQQKINLYENVLESKLKNCEISSEVRELRKEIDHFSKKNEQRKRLNKQRGSEIDGLLLDDKEIEMIKKENLERQVVELQKEIASIEKEHQTFKQEMSSLKKEELDLEKTLNSLNTYIKTNIKPEEIAITKKENLRSFKSGEIGSDMATLALYESFKNN